MLAEQERIFKKHENILKQTNEELMVKNEKLEEEKDQDDEILKLKNDKMDAMERHAADMEEVMADSKTSAAVAVLQAKVEMVEDDLVSWDVEGWKDAIIRLTSVHPEEKKEKVDGGEQVKESGATSAVEV